MNRLQELLENRKIEGLQKFDETRASFLAEMKNLSGEMEVHLETHFLVLEIKRCEFDVPSLFLCYWNEL